MDVDAQRELIRALTARRAGQPVHVDLSGRDLTGAHAVAADLVGADLSHAILTHACFTGARLSRANLEGADLRNCDLGGADLTEANLRHADLTGARLDDAVLAGADLRDTCFQAIEGEPLSMTGARLNQGTIARSELKMRDLARLVVHGAVISEKDSIPPRSRKHEPTSKSQRDLPAAAVVAQPHESLPPSLPQGSLTFPAADVLVSPLESDVPPPPSFEGSIVPSLRAKEIESRQRLADFDDEVPASLRFVQRMNALILEARPSLAPRSSLPPPASVAPPEVPVAMPKAGDEVLGAVLAEVLPGGSVKRTFRGTMADGTLAIVVVFDPEAPGADLQLPAFQRGVRALCRTHGMSESGRPIHAVELLAVATDLTAYAVRYYENGSISTLIDVALTMQTGLEMFTSVCETVAALHREGILVRSFKPSNILIDGLTPVISEVDMIDLPALADFRSDLAGYASFVAPEELVGQGTRSPTADVYALGKLVDYLLTGHEPIAPVGSPPLIADRKGTPAVLVQIVKRCLAKDPADRYQYVDDLLADLRSFEESGAGATLQASMRPGALSRLKSGPSFVPPAPKRPLQVAPKAPIAASEPSEPRTNSTLTLALALLGLGVGLLGLSVFYLAPASVDEMERAQIAVCVIIGLSAFALPAPRRGTWLFRLAAWVAIAGAVYLAQPIRIARIRWQNDLRAPSLHQREAAVERLARLGHRDFRGLDLSAARLAHADLGGARFGGTKLVGADLTSAFLAEADFTDADLRDARIVKADLRGARLEATRNLGKATCDDGTRFPDWLFCRGDRPRMQGPRPVPAAPAQ